MTENRRADALRLLGLAQRAGAVVAGVQPARRSVRLGEARLILKATDASRVQLSKLAGTLGNQPVPQACLGDRATLGAALGRSPVSAVVVTEASFADELIRRLGVTGLPNELEE